MTYATITDLLEVEPTITEYGVLDWDAQLALSETQVNRVLSVRWWPTYAKQARRSITVVGNMELMDATKLDSTQWKMATVYHAMAYHICPKLTQFGGGEPDKFQVMMQYYSQRFEHEMDLCIREGVRYDLNNDEVFTNEEKLPDTYLRLKR